MPEADERPRDSVESFESRSLVGNPLGVPAERELRIYLPPDYYKDDVAYPVIYLLHGYGGDARHPIVAPRARLKQEFPWTLRLLFRNLFTQIVTTDRLDALISCGSLPPFILVQPDGSLHVPHSSGGLQTGGDPKHKGSMYVDSPWTGRFFSSVFEDVVDHVDAHYRTLPHRRSRAVMGGSMGGYGSLLAGIFKPDRFVAVAALSPSICGLDVVDLDLYVPVLRWIRGEKEARRSGRADVDDILDTCDMVFSGDRPLVPTIIRGAGGEAVSMDSEARSNWEKWDAGHLAQTTSGAFDSVALRVTCEERDEFGFAGPDTRFSLVLRELGIPHEFEIFRNNQAARLSAHSAGIALQVERGLRFCLEHMVVSAS